VLTKTLTHLTLSAFTLLARYQQDHPDCKNRSPSATREFSQKDLCGSLPHALLSSGHKNNKRLNKTDTLYHFSAEPTHLWWNRNWKCRRDTDGKWSPVDSTSAHTATLSTNDELRSQDACELHRVADVQLIAGPPIGVAMSALASLRRPKENIIYGQSSNRSCKNLKILITVTKNKARCPLRELTDRVDGWPVSVNSASGNAHPSTRPVLTGNGNRSPINSGTGNRA